MINNADDYYRIVGERLSEMRRGRDKRDRSPRALKQQAEPQQACRIDEPCEACQ